MPPRTATARLPGWVAGLLLLLVSTLLSVAAAEVASRAFWSLRYGVPFGKPGRILYAYYPELERVDRKRPAHGDEFYDVLILGGSTLNERWSQVQRALGEQLAYHGHRNVRMFNLAIQAQTSRDSRLKYAALRGPRFDLVLVYDGINDTRTNNVPPELFREDYGHYRWYETVNIMAAYHGPARFALPYTLRYLTLGVRQARRKDRYLPPEAPREEWLQYGRDVRSAASFEHNLGAILQLASRRGDRVLLMTFATYVPPNYSAEAFKAKRLDYGLHLSPIEEWGRPADVLAAVAAHNRIVRDLAAAHEEVLLVDQASLMAGSPLYFNDVCHLTVAGSSRFAENLLPAVLPTFPTR